METKYKHRLDIELTELNQRFLKYIYNSDKGMIDKYTDLGKFVISLLHKPINYKPELYINPIFNLYISDEQLKINKIYIHKQNDRDKINKFIERQFKEALILYLEAMFKWNININNILDNYYKMLNISEDIFTYERAIKMFYRYRKQKNSKIIENNFGQIGQRQYINEFQHVSK